MIDTKRGNHTSATSARRPRTVVVDHDVSDPENDPTTLAIGALQNTTANRTRSLLGLSTEKWQVVTFKYDKADGDASVAARLKLLVRCATNFRN
jgi:hypothetical protein